MGIQALLDDARTQLDRLAAELRRRSEAHVKKKMEEFTHDDYLALEDAPGLRELMEAYSREQRRLMMLEAEAASVASHSAAR